MAGLLATQDWFAGLLDFVFPPICLGCGNFDESESQICNSCFGAIDTFEFPLCLNCQAFVPQEVNCPVCKDDSILLFAYANYKPPLKDIIIQFKFKGITSPAVTFADLICEKHAEKLKKLKADCLIPIPLHPARENHRGYNQAELIARRISSNTETATENDILERIIRGKPQARLNMEKRIKNVKGVFKAHQSDVHKKRIVLVDDVVTSGATVLEARKVLENADYKVVGIISIAHGV